MLGTLETTFYGQKNFQFGGGITKLVRNAKFSQGGTLRNGAKVASVLQNLRHELFFQTAKKVQNMPGLIGLMCRLWSVEKYILRN